MTHPYPSWNTQPRDCAEPIHYNELNSDSSRSVIYQDWSTPMWYMRDFLSTKWKRNLLTRLEHSKWHQKINNSKTQAINSISIKLLITQSSSPQSANTHTHTHTKSFTFIHVLEGHSPTQTTCNPTQSGPETDRQFHNLILSRRNFLHNQCGSVTLFKSEANTQQFPRPKTRTNNIAISYLYINLQLLHKT